MGHDHPRLVRLIAAVGLAAALLTPAGAAAEPSGTVDVPPAAATATTTGQDSLSVARLYRAFFLRAPDDAGLAYWQAHVRAGYPLVGVATDFARSEEFQLRYGSLDDGAFVDRVYRNVLGRLPDAGGRAHWLGTLQRGLLTRGGVMLSFSDSAEYKAKTGLIGTTSQLTVTARRTGQTELVITDRSGRNLSQVAPTLPERQIFVRLSFPVDAEGRPLVTSALPVHVEGTYRSGAAPLCGQRTGVPLVHACVGYPLMDTQAGVNWGDMPNHPADIGEVLDHLLSDPNLAGLVDDDRIVYSGASMGGISGLYFAGPSPDPRIRAVASWVGFAPFSIPEIGPTTPWRSTPAVLMVNSHDDPDITYELARRTVEHAGPGRVELVTIRSGGHSPSCGEAGAYAGKWIDHHLLGTPLPSTSTLTGCATPGLLPGGTTGYGLAAGFVR